MSFFAALRHAAAVLLAGGAAFAASSVAETHAPIDAPRPEWVEYLAAPTPEDAEIAHAEDGIYYVLFDSQIRLEEKSYTFYRRIVRKVTDPAGLEDAGRLEFVFDPTEDALAIHAIKIIRDGAVIATERATDFKVIQREPDLAEGVTDGDLTAYRELADIKVGDIIDYEFSWTSRSEIWPGEYFSNFSVQWSVPVGLFHWSAIVPHDKPLTIRALGEAPTIEKQERGETIFYRAQLEKPPLLRGEDAVPDSFPYWGEVSVSTLSSWRAVVDMLVGAYESAAPLSADLAAKIVPTQATLEQRITQAVRYVQDEIRYVADETGVGSHLPRSPETVIARGWGDCKDKALLLVAILRALGVDAAVALVDNDAGGALPLLAPSPYAFDHAIVVIEDNGERRWIDATDSHQGGVYPAITAPYYGYGLPIRANSGELLPMEIASAEAPELKTVETFDFAEREAAGVKLTVKSDYNGRRADQTRKTLATQSRSGLAHKYQEYYSGLYAGIDTASDFKISDDRDKNLITIEETYLLPADTFADGELLRAFPLQADAVRNTLTTLNLTSRRAPISLPFPFHAEHIVSIKNTGVEMTGFDDYSQKTADFEFVRNSIPDKNDVWISWRLKTLSDEVPAERAADYGALTKEMDDWNALTYDLETGGAANISPSEIAAMVALAFFIVATIFVLIVGGSAIKGDLATIDRSVLYPVSVTKFVILGVATIGLYTFIWMYRCWRQAKLAENRPVSALFRAFFGVFFFYSLFGEIRRRFTAPRRPPIALGASLATGFLILSLASRIAERVMKTPGWERALVGVSDAVIFLFAVPLVVWTNRLNRDNPDIIADHSRWKVRTFALLFFGLSLWPLVIIGALTPD